jgi:hypothetical protein
MARINETRRQKGGEKSEKQNRKKKQKQDTIAYGPDSGSWGLAPTRACRYTTADKPLLGVWGYEIFTVLRNALEVVRIFGPVCLSEKEARDNHHHG